MANYLLISDIHASERPPSSCTDSYMDDLLDLIYQTVRMSHLYEVRATVWAGDVFHSKAPSRVSHRLMRLLMGLLESYHGPVYVVPGNHDMQNDRIESLADTQPLGVLIQSGLLKPLIGWAEYDGPPGWLPLYGVPWQQKWTDENVSTALAGYRERPCGGLVVAHAPLYPPGQELKWEHYPAGDWAAAMGQGSGYCFYGHVHEPHGVWESGSVTFCNNGALSRGSLHEYNLTRQVGCTIWDGETCQFAFSPLAARPASEVFRLKEKAEVTDMQGRLDTFLESVSGASLEVMSAETVLAHIRTLGLDPSDVTLAEELIQGAMHAAT